jgi:polysaccharide pyruvyl transferase WcaK-like protein
MSAFVGIRLHSVIMAMCAGVPSIMLSYAPKCLDFMTSVDLQALAIDLKELTPDTLASRFEQVISSGKEYGEKIARHMTAFRDRQIQKAIEIRTQLTA